MTIIKTKFAKLRKSIYITGVVFLIVGMISCGNPTTEYTTQEVLTPTNGIVTEVKEMEEDVFRITEETVVPNVEDSRIIAEYTNGIRDTFTMEEAQIEDAEHPKRNRTHGVLMYGMMGYMMGRSMSSPINRSAYASDDAFKKSTTSTQAVKSTAKRSTVKTPKKGYGSSKSTRSYGG